MIVSGYLCRPSLPEVEQCMLGPESPNNDPVAACHIANAIRLDRRLALSWEDSSFTTQMAAITQRPQDIDLALTTPPDAYLVTANSAIPVADSIRGFYDEIGEETPLISFIRAGKKTQYQHEELGDTQNFDEEVARLTDLLAGADHVSVVEQFSDTGKSFLYAGAILEAAGVQNASAIRGRWYHDVWWPKRTVDVDQVTSKYHESMHKIGVRAAKRAGSIQTVQNTNIG